MSRVYTVTDLENMGLGSSWLIYKTVREGTCPFPFIRLGARRIVFPKAAVDRMLGWEPEAAAQ